MRDRYRRIAGELAHVELAPDSRLRLRVNGRSMLPLIRPGDIVVVEPVSPTKLRHGDIVAVRRADDIVTHRLMTPTDNGQVITKGDNMRGSDAPRAVTQVVGRIVALERNGAAVDLTSRHWQVANRILSRLSWLELHLFTAATQIKRRIVGHSGSGWSRSMGTILALPFRLARRGLELWLRK